LRDDAAGHHLFINSQKKYDEAVAEICGRLKRYGFADQRQFNRCETRASLGQSEVFMKEL
jgi:hypothetical protein